jgi:hypothetical protein
MAHAVPIQFGISADMELRNHARLQAQGLATPG